MRLARRSALLPRFCLLLALCFLWSFAVAPCAVAAEAAKKAAASAPKPRHFTSLTDRLANTPYTATIIQPEATPPASKAPTLTPTAAPARSLTLLDEVGRLANAVPPAQVAAWKQELKTTHPSAARAATLHLWLGECALAQDQSPEVALWHERQAQRLTTRRDPLYGLAAYDCAVATFYQGAYFDAADQFHRLILRRTGLTGYDHRTCALWWRHAGACAGYHVERSNAGIPEPPRLDPQCGAAGLATSLRALGLPWDRKTVLASCRVTGEGSNLQDLINAGPKLGVRVRAVTADDAGLRALPKPLVAFCEHDHFIAVTDADKSGVTYLCSDCGPWPGGAVHLTWKQWHLLEPGIYATVTKPGSAWDARLTALLSGGNTAAPVSPVRVSYAGRLSDLHLGRSLNVLTPSVSSSLRGHIARYLGPTPPIQCGYKPTSQQCPPYIICCWDCYEHALQGGASDGDPVNLATGQEEYTPAPDLTVYNPVGPNVVWQRNYASLRSNYPPVNPSQTTDWTYQNSGLGWANSFDATLYGPVSSAGNYDTVTLQMPNGSTINLTGLSSEQGQFKPTYVNGSTGSDPYTASDSHGYMCPVRGSRNYVYLKNPNFRPGNGQPAGWWIANSFTVAFPDGSSWTFAENTVGYAIGPLTRATDRTGRGINLSYSHPSFYQYALTSITNDSGTTLLTVSRNGDGSIAALSDCYGRSVYYHTSQHATANVPSGYPQSYLELDHVSQIVASGTATPPDRYAYGYQNVYNGDPGSGGGEGISTLHTITVPSPAGPLPATASLTVGETGTSTATINYATDGTSLVSSLRDGNGNTHTYTAVDGTHTGVTVADRNGNVAYAYTANYTGNLSDAGRTDGTGNPVSTSVYADPYCLYKPSSVTDGNGNIWHYTWNIYGHLLTATSPRSTVTNYTYQNNYNSFYDSELTKVQEGNKSPTTYTFTGNLIHTVTGPRPGTVGSTSTVATAYTYDGLGNLLSVTTPGNNATSAITTTYNYTTDGGYSQSAAVGQPLTVTDNLGKVTHLRYDSRGNRLSTTDALGNETDTTYNIANQPLQTAFPATGQQGPGRAASLNAYLYPGGPLTGVTSSDESGAAIRQVNYAYGPEGESLGTSGSTEPVAYTYDALYRLSGLTDGGGSTTRYFYNTAGYLYQVAYPGAAATPPTAPLPAGSRDTVTFPQYDTDGNLLTRTDGNGVTTTYTHNADPESLLTAIHYAYPAGYASGTTGDVSFSYDAYGRRSAMADGTGTQTDTYDDEDSPLSVTTTYTGLPAQVLTYAYWPDGSRSTMGTPIGSFSYAYDAVGRMASLTNPYAETSSWHYLDNGWLNAQTLGNGAVTAYTYNARGFVTDLANRIGGGALLSDFSGQTYSGVGDRTALTASLPAAPSAYSGQTAYQYDYGQTANPALNRSQLTQEQSTRSGGYTNGFAYDGGTSTGPGNPTTFRGVGHTFNADNQDAANTYDGNGNPTLYAGAGLALDQENRLITYGSALAAGYTGDGLRAWKQGAAGRTYFLYDGDEPICELDGSGSVTAVNTSGGNGLLSRHTSGGSAFYTFDPSGNVAQRLDGGGSVLSSDLYDAFGQRQSTASAANVFGYGGQWGYYTDAETGLALCTHRFYDPNNGRWLTRDPLGYGGGVNLYGYVGNNPINFSDPSGYISKAARCRQLLQQILKNGQELIDRLNDMDEDHLGLYPIRHEPWPNNTRRDSGGRPVSWDGHQQKYEDLREEQEELLAEYKRLCSGGDPVPGWAKKCQNVPARDKPNPLPGGPIMNWPTLPSFPVWLRVGNPIWDF